jgi:ATP synthase subunit C
VFVDLHSNPVSMLVHFAYSGMILILIFAEVLGLYGLIVALILNTMASKGSCN